MRSASSDVRTRVEMQVKTRVKAPQQILFLLQQQPHMTLAEVAATLGRAVSTIEHEAAKLQADGKLRYQGPKKCGRWEVL